MRSLLRFLFVVAWMLSVAVAHAQNQPKPQRETLRASGSIKAMARGYIQMVTEEGEEWVIKVEAKPDSLRYYAEAEPSWLKSGMFVKFSGRFNKQGQAEGEIRSLAVVTPSAELPLGIKVDVGLTTGADLFSKPKANPEPKKEIFAADVVGKLTALKNGEFSVAAPGAVVRGQLAEKAIVSVEYASLAMAKVGDSIEVNGWYPPGSKGRAIASGVTVRAKEPLKGYVKPPRKVREKPATGKPAADPLNGPPDPLNGPK